MKEGWEIKKLGKVGKVSMCKRILKEQTSILGDVPFYKIGTFGKEPDAYISKEIYNEFRKKFSFPKQGVILISASGTIGRRVRYDGKPAYFQDSNIVWIDNDATNFIGPDGNPMTVQQFLNALYGKIPDLFNSEAELRKIWSSPITRKTLLDKLDEAGFGKDELTNLQKIIDAEKCDLFDVLEFVAYSATTLTREQRVASAQTNIFSMLDNHQKEFLEFVLTKYIETGVEELDREKLPVLLTNKYHSLEDAKEVLGDASKISSLFIEFQKHLYEVKTA